MKPSKKQQTEWSATAKIALAVVAICGLAGTALAAVYYWPEGPERKIADLQQQMLAEDADQLTERQKERIQDQLIREVDQLDGQQRRDVWEGVRERFRERLRSGVEEFHALPEADRAKFVDAELADLGRWRNMLYTMRPQEPYVPRRFRVSEQEAIAREQALAKEAGTAGGDISAPDERRPDRGGPRGLDRGGPRGPDRGGFRGPDGGGRGGPRGPDRGRFRGPDRGGPRGPDRGGARGPDRGGAQGPDRGGARGSDGGGARGSDGGGARGSDGGRRRGWGFGAPEEGMEDQYVAYWKALQQRRRELWEARNGSRDQASQADAQPQRR